MALSRSLRDSIAAPTSSTTRSLLYHCVDAFFSWNHTPSAALLNMNCSWMIDGIWDMVIFHLSELAILNLYSSCTILTSSCPLLGDIIMHGLGRPQS
jgi:hypothetical protein